MSENVNQDESFVNQEAGPIDAQYADSKEDMFVDAPEELNADQKEAAAAATESNTREVSQEKLNAGDVQFSGMDNNGVLDGDADNELDRMRVLWEKAVKEKESVQLEFEQEREAFYREVADLRHQIEALTDKQSPAVENEENTVVQDVSLHETISECSKLLHRVKEKRLQDENMIKELQGVLDTKNVEIEELNTKLAHLSVSSDIASCYLDSIAGSESDTQLEKIQHVEVFIDRMLVSLAAVVSQEEVPDDSIISKITHVEKCTTSLIENYYQILYEVDQLGQSLSSRSDNNVQKDFWSIFGDAHNELGELKRKEVELIEKLSNIEDANRKLVEQVDKHKDILDQINGELGKTKMELEKEKNKCGNTKEKLSMAVTKGKALVQQRDALKQAVSEKTKELEKCMTELQEKSSALEASELSRAELEQKLIDHTEQLEKCVIDLQEKTNALEAAELSKGELEQALAEKIQELSTGSVELLEKSRALEAVEQSKAEMEQSLAEKIQELNKGSVELLEKSRTLEAAELSRGELEQSLVDKTNELEKCMTELQEKTSALESVDVTRGESEQSLAVKNEEIQSLLSDLQQKSSMLEASEQIKAELEKLLMDKSNELEKCSIELQEKLSTLEATELSKGELQQSLTEKTNEVGTHLVELQQKSSALVVFEQSKGELEQLLMDRTNELDKCLTELQEKSTALDAAESSKSELQQSIAEKDGEIEKLLIELQQKSLALEVSEQSKGEPVISERSIASMQETLSEKNLVLENLEKVLSQIDLAEQFQSMNIVERVTQLVAEINHLKGVALDFRKCQDAISLIELPENIFFPDLESRLGWLRESFDQAKEEINMLQIQIERLTTSLSSELQEKDHFRLELDDLASRHEEVVKKANQMSSEKDLMVRVLIESSGITMEHQEEGYQTLSDLTMLIDRCFRKIKEQLSVSSDTLSANAESFERAQCLLYVRDQELKLCEELLGEEMLAKEEKDSLLKDLERSEERSLLLREKLSMAVKKGKGLVQDRENLRRILDEKNTEIDKLKIELQQQVSTIDECRGQFNMLSADVDRIPKLEADLDSMKEQCAKVEQLLSQSNNMLQRVIESIDGFPLPINSVFEEPIEKVNWLAGFVNECQHARIQAEQELEKVKEETSTLASKLMETEVTIKSLEEARAVAEYSISRLSEEKRDIEEAKENIEHELQKAVEEACSTTSKYAEAGVARATLEDALAKAESTISELINEKEESRDSIASMEMELENVKEEVSNQASKLAESYNTIKSLENALSEAQSNIALLSSQNSDAEAGRINLQDELKKLKDETESQASKLTDSHMIIKSLEEALVKAENKFAVLENEKSTAELEISTLNSKLSACMEDLAGTSGSLDTKSLEFIGYLNDLQVILKDNSLFSELTQCFTKKFQSLKDMDLIIRDIKDYYVDEGSEGLKYYKNIEENLHRTSTYLNDLDDAANIKMENGLVTPGDGNDISLFFRKATEGFKSRNKVFVDKVKVSSGSIDDLSAATLRNLQVTKDHVVNIFEQIESLKQNVKNLEKNEHEQEEAIAMLENDATVLLSASSEAARELQFEVKNKLLELGSFPEFGKLQNDLLPEMQGVGGDDTTHQQRLDGSKYVSTAQELSSAKRKMQSMVKLFESTSTVAAEIIQTLDNRLRETTTAFEKVVEERDQNQTRVYELEADMETLQVSCGELRYKVEELEAKEGKWYGNQAEVSPLHNNVSKAEDPSLSASQLRALFDKINGITISCEESVGELDLANSSIVDKLFYIIDSVPELQHKILLSSREKEELQSTLSTQNLKIEQLKEKTGVHASNQQDSQHMRTEISELTFGLEKVINLLGRSESGMDQKATGVRELLPVLEKQIMTLLYETENSKAKTQELGLKLLDSQKFVDELSTKIKVLEGLPQSKSVQPKAIQERSIYEAPSLSGSEISEIEEAGSVAKKAIAPVPTAAHVRTMRKGSTDHLAINIGSESVGLINNEESDEDKGHAFKSLNTSGLIPNQGKMYADRIDKIWVSGGRLLMNRPRARLGLIAYWLFLHLWLLGTIL